MKIDHRPQHRVRVDRFAPSAIVAVVLVGAVFGVLVVLDDRVALVFAAIAAGGAVRVVPAEHLLFVALLMRSLSDWEVSQRFIDATTVNAGISATLVLGACALGISGRVPSAALRVAALAAALIGLSHVYARTVFGDDPALAEEALRVLSLLAAGLLGAATKRPLRLLRGLLVAGLAPACVAVVQAAGGDRATATMSHPNVAAVSFGSLAIVAIALALDRRRVRSGSRYWAAAALMFAGALATGSMAGVGSMIIGTVVLVVVATDRRRHRLMTAGMIGVLSTLVFVLSPVGQERLEELSSTRNFSEVVGGTSSDTTNSLDWRFYNWGELLDEIEKRPLLGHGLGATSGPLQPGGNLPHNEYLRIVAEAGLIGLAFAGTAMVLLWRRLRRSATPGLRPEVAASMGVLALLAVNAAAANTILYTAPMLFVAALLGCSIISRPRTCGVELSAPSARLMRR